MRYSYKDKARHVDGKTSGGILKASAFLLIITLGARALSMVREMLLASHIGMNAYTDAFNISQSAITFCTGAIGATCLALVPILAKASKEGECRRDELFTSILISYMFISVIVATLLSIFALPLCKLLGPGMNAESQAVAADLLRIGFIKINCVVGGSLFAYYLQSREVFVASGLASLASSALVVVLLIMIPDATIYDYTRYTVYGFIAQIIVPIPSLIKVRYRPRIRTLLEKDAIRTLVIASVPLMASAMFFQVQTLVGRAILTGFGEGAASSVDYANKIIQLVNASVTTSLNTVLFTKLANSTAEGKTEIAANYMLSGAKTQLMLLIPVVLIAISFGQPLIALLFQRGAFTAEDTASVYAVLLGYLAGIWPYVLSDLFTRYYVSLGKTRIINVVNGIGYGISLIVVYPAALLMQAPGVSMSFSLAQIIILGGFLIVFLREQGADSIRQNITSIISTRDFLPAVLLLLALLCCRAVLGLPNPWAALALSGVLFIAYCLTLYVFRVKVGFKGI